MRCLLCFLCSKKDTKREKTLKKADGKMIFLLDEAWEI